MKLMFIRHGEPAFPKDEVTQDGAIESEILSDYLIHVPMDEIYVSPLKRAQQTAAPTLAKLHREAITLPWLREFNVHIDRPDRKEPASVAWDWVPADWTADPRFLDPAHWRENPVFEKADVGGLYDHVTQSFDALLAEHGYRRDGLLYRVEQPNTKVLAFFCHFGVATVLLSHLINISPMPLWHGTVMLPTSITTVYTEERRKGTASFRASAIGETPHLTLAGRAPSFAARFCEVHGDGTRED